MQSPVRRRDGLRMIGGLAAACASLPWLLQPSAAAAGDRERDSIRAMLVEEAANLQVDPALALAMAHVESYFDPRAESHVGARGVMQIMPATCRGEYAIHPDALWEPRINIRMGLHFIQRLLHRYRQHEHFALSYYNGGSRVGRLPNARVIPATRPYVDKVGGLKQRYRQHLDTTGARAWSI